MNQKIAVLRGINVGGKRKILMADLKLMCENLGLKNVKTYIQSGNLIFNSDKQNAELETILENEIATKFGFKVPVIVKTKEELEQAIKTNPFYNTNSEIHQLHLTFLKAQPNTETIKKIMTTDNLDADKFKIEQKNIFIFCAGKYHQSKLTNTFFEKKLNVGATTRNWKTVLKLSELSN